MISCLILDLFIISSSFWQLVDDSGAGFLVWNWSYLYTYPYPTSGCSPGVLGVGTLGVGVGVGMSVVVDAYVYQETHLKGWFLGIKLTLTQFLFQP